MKKGFTLIELLAVIAILAILVIIAIPNIIELYNKSKKEIFVTEIKNVYKKVEENYVSTKLKEEHIFRINSEDNTKLDMNGNKLKYCIILNDEGKILFMNASDGNYIIEINKNNKFEDINKDNVTEGNLNDFNCKSIPATLE